MSSCYLSIISLHFLLPAVTGSQYEEMVTAITSMGYERDQVHYFMHEP